jgi:TetR/AcrR family transcriptional regulator, transcriptional repressor for nem operon
MSFSFGKLMGCLIHNDQQKVGCPIQFWYAEMMAVNQAEAGDGRRLTRRGQQTRQRIVAAAAELMFENGVAETTLEDIRAAAGVSGSQVYHYFDDKQALVRAVIDYQADAVLDAQGGHLDHLDTVPGLRAWRDFIVEHQRRLGCRGGCPIGALGAEVAETDTAARVAAARALRRWEGRIRAGLQTMHARGGLPTGTDPEQLALATLAALQGGLLMAQLERDTRPLEAALDAMLDRIQSLASAA